MIGTLPAEQGKRNFFRLTNQNYSLAPFYIARFIFTIPHFPFPMPHCPIPHKMGSLFHTGTVIQFIADNDQFRNVSKTNDKFPTPHSPLAHSRCPIFSFPIRHCSIFYKMGSLSDTGTVIHFTAGNDQFRNVSKTNDTINE